MKSKVGEFAASWQHTHTSWVGEDWACDSAAIAADEATQRWWRLTEPCQAPLDDRAPGEWWAALEEVFHTD